MNKVHHISTGWPLSLATKGIRTANQQWFIGAKAPNELCRGKTSWQNQQIFLQPLRLVNKIDQINKAENFCLNLLQNNLC